MHNENATIKDKINQLLDLTGLGAMPDAVVEATVKQFRDKFGIDAVDADAPESALATQLKAAFTLVDSTLRSRRDDLRHSIVAVYENLFSETEIDELIAFHTSAVGRQLSKLGPSIQKAIIDIESVWCNDALKSIEGELAAILAVAPPPAGDIAIQELEELESRP